MPPIRLSDSELDAVMAAARPLPIHCAIHFCTRSRMRSPIPVAQQVQQPGGEHRKAILAALPCSIRSSRRSESMSDTFSATTSETRRLAA